MKLTIIIPAFNEEAYLPSTLDSIKTAAAHLRSDSDAESDIIVVDNNSEDETAAVARSKGATVIHEPVQGIARARNAGAGHADGDVLVFVDADVILPSTLLAEIHTAMSDPACVGGAVDVECRPKRRFIRAYLGAWRLLSRLTGMAQGATQFCRKSVFDEVGGYDEQTWIGEDADFFWALKKLASRTGRSTRFIESPRVQASSRRFDKWPIWKILLWTNPLFIALFRRRKAFWSGWYSRAVR
ncbi:MAG: glycosyltransferase [Chloroflexota bacterium]|nr:glycosyltransferase [Chloroflexota bacterium]